jgi:hypothetical protein
MHTEQLTSSLDNRVEANLDQEIDKRWRQV